MRDVTALMVYDAVGDQPDDPRRDADAKVIDGVLYVAMPDIVATLRDAAAAYFTGAHDTDREAADYMRDLADDWERQAQGALSDDPTQRDQDEDYRQEP